MRISIGLIAFSTIAWVACSSSECADVALPAISVTPVDSIDGQDLSAITTGVLTDGTYTDGLTPGPGEGALDGAHGRPGQYTIELNAEGYQTWTRASVTVRSSDCGGVETVHVVARLVRG